MTHRRGGPLGPERRRQLVLVLRRARVRERQVLEHVLVRLLVLLLADDDVVELGVLALGRVDAGHLGDELARVLLLLGALARPCALRACARESGQWLRGGRRGRGCRERERGTHPARERVVLLARRVSLNLLALLLGKVLQGDVRQLDMLESANGEEREGETKERDAQRRRRRWRTPP